MDDEFFTKLSLEYQEFLAKLDEENSLLLEISKGLLSPVKYTPDVLFSLRKFILSLKFYGLNTRARKDLSDDIKQKMSRPVRRKFLKIRLNLISSINDIQEIGSQTNNDSVIRMSKQYKQLQSDINLILALCTKKFETIIQLINILTDSVTYYRHKRGLLKKQKPQTKKIISNVNLL